MGENRVSEGFAGKGVPPQWVLGEIHHQMADRRSVAPGDTLNFRFHVMLSGRGMAHASLGRTGSYKDGGRACAVNRALLLRNVT